MNAARITMFTLGVILVVVAAWLLFFQTGLNKIIPAGIAGAALLLFIGVAVMGAAETIPHEHGGEHGEHHDAGPAVIEKRVEEHR